MEEISPVKTGRVGYWWSEKKSRKFNVKEFIKVCQQYGLDLVKINLDEPLEDQGPFTAIVHKLTDAVVKADQGDATSRAICNEFKEYLVRHPEVIVIDSLPNIEKLLNRFRQYKLVEDSELQEHDGVFVPAFVELSTKDVQENIAKMKAAGVSFPCVCKPSVAHGSSLSHKMCLIFNEEGLKDINPPCVVQKFINHNAVLFKLFIIDDKYFVSERPSLKNFTAGDHKTIFFHSHDISKPFSASPLTELDASEPKIFPVCPEKERLDYIVDTLCDCLGLSLFGIDVIIDNETGRYAIIDTNIFPGYDEVDNFFELLCKLILKRISQRVTSHCALTSEPGFKNPSRLPASKPQTVPRNFGTESSVMTNEGNSALALTPYNGLYNAFTLQCKNAMVDFTKHIDQECHLDFSKEMTEALKHVRNEDCKMQNFSEYTGDKYLLQFPDNTQDDSGIETSDSSDEKKRATVLKTVKRLHSRNHVVSRLEKPEQSNCEVCI